MSLTNLTTKTPYAGNGVTTVFPFTFKVFQAADLVVTETNALGVTTPLVLNTDYTVTGVGLDAGGSITRIGATSPPPTGTTGLIRRVLALVQTADIRNQSAFYAGVHEDVFDKLTMMDQQQEEEIGRCIQLPEQFSTGVSMQLPQPVALTALAWNASGTGLINIVIPGTTATYVASFNDRIGAVVPASGDYTVAQVTGAAPLASPTFTGVAGFSAGTAAAPSINFGDAGTGFYRPALNQIGFTINGVTAATLSANVVTFGNSRLISQGTVGVARTLFLGEGAGNTTTTGTENVGIGYTALSSVTGGTDPAGSYNTAVGSYSLALNTTGDKNSAFGRATLDNNTTGIENTAIGYGTLHWNVSGNSNVALGMESVHNNVSGLANTGLGYRALYASTGDYNTAIGMQAGTQQVAAYRNTFVGVNAGYGNITGTDNVGVGYNAGVTSTGSGNIFIGQGADAAVGLANVTVIGTGTQATQSNTLILGNSQNVGIGTITPGAKLDVVGTIRSSSTVTATNFIGPGTGLTGTAASLTAGNAAQLGGVAAASYALLASPTFTGTPTAPTATVGTNTTQLATTAFVLANGGSGGRLKRTVFTSSGSWTCPTGVTFADVTLAGGGGAGGDNDGVSNGGGGGGAGATLVERIPVTAGTQYDITIGAGGTISLGAAGNNGGDTTFATHLGATLATAKGGIGGGYGGAGGAGAASGGVDPQLGGAAGVLSATAGNANSLAYPLALRFGCFIPGGGGGDGGTASVASKIGGKCESYNGGSITGNKLGGNGGASPWGPGGNGASSAAAAAPPAANTAAGGGGGSFVTVARNPAAGASGYAIIDAIY